LHWPAGIQSDLEIFKSKQEEEKEKKINIISSLSASHQIKNLLIA
jgi:hypothetical protein